MDNIKTYAVGNGEITLSAEDAEELRIMLQSEHLERFIRERIKEHHSCFSFTPSSLRHFVDDMVRMNSDMIDYDSSYYAEVMDENLFNRAAELNLLR